MAKTEPASALHLAEDQDEAVCDGVRGNNVNLDRQHQPLLVVDFHFKHMHAGNIEHRIGPGAPAHTRTTHTVGHRRGLCQRAWMLLSPVKPDLLVGINV